MKILSKPKTLPIECRRCGCCYKPKLRNLIVNHSTGIRDIVKCPICKTTNPASFDKTPKESEK